MKKIRKTQVNSLKALTPTIGMKQQTVYGAIKTLGKATNRMIAKSLGWDINRVTGRVTELRDKGLIVYAKSHFDTETNRTVNLWKLK